MFSLHTITAKQISIIRGICHKTARKERQIICDSLSISDLKVRDFCLYHSIPEKEVIDFLFGAYRK